MDNIPGAMLNDLQTFLSESQRSQASFEGFQAKLENAMDKIGGAEEKEIREACEAFESYFFQIMLREMRKTSFNEGGYLDKSYAEKLFTDMLDEEISKNLARSGGIGLADQMLRQMTAGSLYQKEA